MANFWTETTTIDHDVTVAPEVTLDVVVVDQDIAVSVDTELDLQIALTDTDLQVENAEAEEYIDVVISVGEKGDTGDKGEAGDDGPPGDGLQIDASGTFAGRDAYDAELAGFTYLDTTAGLLYVRETAVAGTWSPGVDFGGADGTSGNTILSGIIDPVVGDGVAGDFFINTATNFIFGPKTTVWPVGVSIKGDPGTVGTDGNTVLYGNYVPTSHGIDGNFFIHTGTYFMYGPKAAGVWPAGSSLVGPTGADGNTVLYGIANPTSQGNDGDFYINTITSFIFGPKGTPTPGEWPAGATLVGAAGADGNTILYGIGDPTAEGVDGNFYINTATNFLFGPKASDTWPAGTSLVGPQGVEGASFTVDATGLFSGRSAYDSEAEGFSYLATDEGNLYIRETATPGMWSTAIPFGKGDPGEGVQVDATGSTAGRAVYDTQLEGFSYLDTDLALLYFRETVTSGIWSTGVPFGVGPKGDQGDPGPAGVYTGAVIFSQPTEPVGAVDGDIWIDIS